MIKISFIHIRAIKILRLFVIIPTKPIKKTNKFIDNCIKNIYLKFVNLRKITYSIKYINKFFFR
jgi:hypothetical protein